MSTGNDHFKEQLERINKESFQRLKERNMLFAIYLYVGLLMALEVQRVFEEIHNDRK